MTTLPPPYNRHGPGMRGDAMQTYCFVVDPVSDRDEKAIRSVIANHELHAKAARLRNRAGIAFLEVVVAEERLMERICHLAALQTGRAIPYQPWRPA